VHEIGGHAAVAALLGCRLERLRLFLFGGGWVDFACPAPLPRAAALAIDLGGIALQVGVGVLLALLARGRRGFAGFLATSVGLLFVLHGLFYLVTGVHEGAGDGRSLHRLLAAGPARTALVAIGSAVLVTATFAAALRLAGRIALWAPASTWGGRAALVAGAALAAAAAHGALQQVEQRWRADPVYAATFEPEHERALAAALRRLEAEAQRLEDAPRAPAAAPEALLARRAALEQRFAVFPLKPVLGVAMAAAAAAGVTLACRRPPGTPHPLPLRAAMVAFSLAFGLVLAVTLAA